MTTDEAETERLMRYAPEELVDGLLGAVEEGLEELLDSRNGYGHSQLDPTPEEALLALVGEPPDDRDAWTDLAKDLRGHMMRRHGLSLGSC